MGDGSEHCAQHTQLSSSANAFAALRCCVSDYNVPCDVAAPDATCAVALAAAANRAATDHRDRTAAQHDLPPFALNHRHLR
jgi:hypothetical protein